MGHVFAARRIALALVAAFLCAPVVLAAGEFTGAAARLMARADDDDLVDVIIVMAPSTESALRAARPREVGARLRALAERSQAPLFAELNDWRPTGQVRRAVTLPIINGVWLTATKRVVAEIGTRPDVAYIHPNSNRRIPPVYRGDRPGAHVRSVPWHIATVRADVAWADFSFRGEGIVVANIDTGVDVSHPALAANYRGGSNSWFDAIEGLVSPYDDHGHGTATMGNTCGDDSGASFFGVAPKATFIAGKAFDNQGSGGDADILACANWMLDPDGDPNTDDMPDVVNNSWGGGSRDPWFRTTILAWDQAGIYPVFAAGNDGPAPRTVNSPGDYIDVMGVGATRQNNSIASFSARGPVRWAGVDYLKPNVCAPGSGVIVPRRGGGYINGVGGTSFSCPHVAGAAALIRQQRGAIGRTDLNSVLESTAVDLGPAGPDNDFGHGLLDVHAALLAGGGANRAPQLTFVGTPGYESDGLDPETGVAGTDFTWKIVYADADGEAPVDGVKLHVRKAGAPIAGSPFAMSHEGPAAFDTGEIYSLTRRLPKGDHTHLFEASDGTIAAISEGTVETPGPSIDNTPPALTWTGETGYVDDGIDPDVGDPKDTRFRFAVQYADADGDAPRSIWIDIDRCESPFRRIELAPHGSRDYVAGVVFVARPKLPAGRYRYRFFAHDGGTSASGDPRRWRPGPALRIPPALSWQGGPGYEDDGVAPDDGTAYSTVFDFRVKVGDPEGRAPDYVRLMLRRRGTLWATLDMTPRPWGSDRMGRVYRLKTKLPPGSFAYRFVAEDPDGMAAGPPTQWQWGLLVTREGAAARITSLTANSAGRAADIALSLSGPAELTCRVLNLAGRPVRTLCRDRNYSAGVQRLAWDARSLTGTRVPEGTYLIEATIRDRSGAESRALTPLTLRRR